MTDRFICAVGDGFALHHDDQQWIVRRRIGTKNPQMQAVKFIGSTRDCLAQALLQAGANQADVWACVNALPPTFRQFLNGLSGPKNRRPALPADARPTGEGSIAPSSDPPPTDSAGSSGEGVLPRPPSPRHAGRFDSGPSLHSDDPFDIPDWLKREKRPAE